MIYETRGLFFKNIKNSRSLLQLSNQLERKTITTTLPTFTYPDINKLNQFLDKEVKNKAHRLDTQPLKLKEILKMLGEQSLLSARIPKKYGGLELDVSSYHFFKKTLARYSGALAFLHTQHQTAATFIALSNNEFLKESVLPKMVRGELLIGVGLNILLKHEKPPVKGIINEAGYKVNGNIHFISGYDIFDKILIGSIAEEKEILSLIPFKTMPSSHQGTLTYSEPMDLVTISAANTVSLTLEDWIINQQEVVLINPLGSFFKNNLTNTNFDSFHAGTALAALDTITNHPKLKEKIVERYYNSLIKEIEDYETTILGRTRHTLVAPIRAWGIDLVNRCVNFAIIVSGGSVIRPHHPLQRISREAMMFSVISTDNNLLEAVIKYQETAMQKVARTTEITFSDFKPKK
jgi:hypothetical protein